MNHLRIHRLGFADRASGSTWPQRFAIVLLILAGLSVLLGD